MSHLWKIELRKSHILRRQLTNSSISPTERGIIFITQEYKQISPEMEGSISALLSWDVSLYKHSSIYILKFLKCFGSEDCIKTWAIQGELSPNRAVMCNIFQIHLNVLENYWNVSQQYLFTFHPCIGILVWGHVFVLRVGVKVMISLILQFISRSVWNEPYFGHI